MTWALTKPLSMDEELPFIESDYRIRVPHPNYQLLFELEEQIVKAQLEQKIKSAVVVSGVPYGYEENELYPIFEKAYCYTHVPIYSQENNIIPIVHVDNLAQIIKTTIKHIGHVKIPFVFAKDPVQSNMIYISKAISSSLGTGICEFHSKEFAIIDDMVSQELFDKVTSKVYLESCYPLFREEDIPWNYKSGFTANINHIVKEFVEAKHHKPLRLIFYNVSDSGELKNAVQGISNYYKIPFINVQHEISKYAEDILNKQAMIEGNNLLGSPEMQNIHNLKSSNLTPGLVLCDVEKCKEDVEPIINAIKNYTSNGATLSKLSDNVNIMARLLKRNPYIYQGYILNEYPQNPEEANIIFYQNNGETSNSDEITNIQNSPDLVIFYNKQTSFQKLDMLSQQTGSEKNSHRVSVVSTHHEQDLKMSTSTNLSDAVSKSLKGEPFVDTQVRTELHTNETVNTMESFFLKLGEKCKVTTVDFTDRDTEDDVFYKTLCVIKKYCYLRDPETVVPSSTSESFQCVETISDMEYPMKTNYQVSKSKPEVANRIKDEVTELEQNEVEEITLAIRSYPLISYLVNNIFPTLTNGIFKVAVQIPQDPIDFLAEYIFKNNPQGYMITIPQKKLNLDDNNFLRHKKNDVPKIDSKACLA
ncbi:adenylate kinase 7-like [Macrosteles quadrilineatus]|uniref:adenylate kinase 7-like n=1 Tax=Macrosteles quadrilineatus TaxID=74068 RepID=UPI0023E18A93|nr:adenylate kinase 7-like [Macrosteles quadrilineatus]